MYLTLNSINIFVRICGAVDSFSSDLSAPKPFSNKIQCILEVLSELLAHRSPEIVGVVAFADGGSNAVIGCLSNRSINNSWINVAYTLTFELKTY